MANVARILLIRIIVAAKGIPIIKDYNSGSPRDGIGILARNKRKATKLTIISGSANERNKREARECVSILLSPPFSCTFFYSNPCTGDLLNHCLALDPISK